MVLIVEDGNFWKNLKIMNEYKIGRKESITCGGLKKLSKPKWSCQSKSKYPDNKRHAGITANKKFLILIIVIITLLRKPEIS